RRNDGRDDAHRESPRHRDFAVAARVHDGRRDRERIQRSDDEYVSRGAVRGRARALRPHGRRERDRPAAYLARGARHRRRKPGAMNARAFRRHLTSRLMTGLVVALSFLAVLALVLIIGNLVLKGASSIDWAFFTRSPVPAGQTGGGVANAIVGTGIVVGIAALIGVPIGVGAGLDLAEYGGGKLGFGVRVIARVLNGTASIVVGIVAWTFIVRPTHRFSALAGSVALAVLMVPMLARTTEEMVRLVPHSLREAALALGYPRWRTSLK